jgi:Xaa-Pro aminopeptidase
MTQHAIVPISTRLGDLRREMAKANIDGFVVPRADEYQGEYVPAANERLAWITGFTGSAGTAVILTKRAAVFVDGRYTVQVMGEVDADLFERLNSGDVSHLDWIERHASQGQVIGYDPWTHTIDAVARLAAAAARKGATIKALSPSPLDLAWTNRPAPPKGQVIIHDLDVAGEAAEAKRMRIAQALSDAGQEATVLTLSDSIAWTLNIRGADVPRTPFALSYAILNADGTLNWFIDPDKISNEVRRHVGNGVRIEPPDAFGPALHGLANKKIRIDPASAPQAVETQLKAAGAVIDYGADPVQLPKACKNPVELAGTRAAHIRDGAVITRFLHWLSLNAASGEVDEIGAAEVLHGFRRETGLLRDLSFDTISGAGPNGALPHYRVSKDSNRKLKSGELYLVDSGGQYRDGTTDITRTIAVGPAGQEECTRFTLVLKGHIQLACARFPEGTTGSQLDALARHALWQAGLDYDHGTGHGVGSYLSVHEGPQRIAKVPNTVALRPGMILSNEPGFYKPDCYGIRIENLIIVTAPSAIPGGDRLMMGFETITLAPIDRHLIDARLLTDQELDWLNRYHQRVWDQLHGLVPDDVSAWLFEATRPITR